MQDISTKDINVVSSLSGWKDDNLIKKNMGKRPIPYMHQKLQASASPNDPPSTTTRRSLLSVI